MQQLRLRNITPDPVKSEEDRVSCTPKKKYGSFCGRTCVVLATAGIIGSLYYLVNYYGSSDKLNIPTCFNATQYTQKTGFSAPNEHDLYCTYSDHNLPKQMADLVRALESAVRTFIKSQIRPF